MPSMKLPESIAGVGSKLTLVLLDRVVEVELVEAHVNARIGTVDGDSVFIDDGLLCKFKILRTNAATADRISAVKLAIAEALHNRTKREIDLPE